MRKRFLFFFIGFPFLCLLLTTIFWGGVKQTFFEWTLKEYCKKCLGYRISYEKVISHDHNIIQIKGLKITPAHPERFSCGSILCPNAYVVINFDFQSKSLDTQVYLEDFDLYLEEPVIEPSILTASCGKSHKLFFDPHLSVQGKGNLIWNHQQSSVLMDFDFGQKVVGSAQVDHALIQFSLGEESQSLHIIGHQMDAAKLMGLAELMVPVKWPCCVEGGKLSGVLIIQDGLTCGALESQDLVVSNGSLRGSFPEVKYVIRQGEGKVSFRSGTISKGNEQIQDVSGDIVIADHDYHLKSLGQYRGIQLVTDVRFGEKGFAEDSKIQLDSDLFHGEIVLNGKKGYAYLNGSCDVLGVPVDLPCFEIEAQLNPSWCGLGCGGQVVLFGEGAFKQSLDFHLFIDQELTLREGSFQGKHIRVNNLPQISVWNQKVSLGGYVDVEGDFDQSQVSIFIKTNDLRLINDNWNFTLGRTSSLHVSCPFTNEDFLLSGNFEHGVFEHAPTGLVLTGVSASYQGGEKKLCFEQLSGICEEVQVGGDAIVTLSPEVDVEFYQHTLNGKVSDIKRILSRIGVDHAFLTLPIEGNLSYQDEGAFFKWNARTGEFQGTVGALLTEGSFEEPFLGTSWGDLRMNFVYDVATDYLEVRDGGGTLILPKGESLPLIVDHLVFVDISRSLFEFDFWCGDKKRDIFRACGQTVPFQGGVKVVFDQQATHLGALYPDELDLVLGPKGIVEEFRFETCFQIETVEKDLKRFASIFGQSGVLLSLNQMLTGDFLFRLGYERNQWDYFLHGKNVSLAGKGFQKLHFVGTLQENEWRVQQLSLDDFSLAADLAWVEDGYRVNFLGCEWSETSLIGMDGKVSPDLNRIEANLNLVDLDLSELEKVIALQGFFSQYQPQGNLRANGGRLVMELKEGEWDIDLSFIASLKNFSLDGIPFFDTEKISVEYQTNKMLVIEGVKSSTGADEAIKVDLNKTQIDFSRNEMTIEGLDFRVPSSQLGPLTTFLEKKFPGAVNSAIGNVLREIKTVEPVVGRLNFHLNPVRSVTEVVFDDGEYRIFDHDLNLKDFKFRKVDGEINLFAQCQLLDEWITFNTHFVGKAFPHGVLEVKRDEDDLLQVWWKKGGAEDPQFLIEKVQGMISGTQLAMERDNQVLAGTVKSDDLFLNLEMTKDQVMVSDIKMNFMKGVVTCPKIMVERHPDGHWEYQIPAIQGCSLHSDQLGIWNEFVDEAVVVDNIELKDIHGSLDHPEAISGKGFLSFSSPNQPELRAIAFVKEKIQNLSILRPSSGTLEFQADHGELILSRLHHVVDQRKLFRYALPTNKKSYLGADGGVHLIFNLLPNHQKVKMGDQVSIVVEGTLKNPTFSLQKTGDVLRR
ncbi:MAG: hypothetical protein K940chlam3_01317 [Chlamydiae bacterium]|nr:hypothetical protein [Chlamydiota bacterium]